MLYNRRVLSGNKKMRRNPLDMNLKTRDKNNLLLEVRRNIEIRLFGTSSLTPDLSGGIFSVKTGAFVTIHANSILRGCIGYIEGIMPLRDLIRELSISAAFRDPRFPPLTADEYKSIDIEISLLSPVEKVKSFSEIIPGKDGLIISKGLKKGLLLPQVALEYGMSREEFISHTCMKAGLMPDEWKKEELTAEKFTVCVFGEKSQGLSEQ